MTNENNNKVTVTGTVATEPCFSHEIYGEKFYVVNMAIKRQSGYEDVIPALVSEYIVAPKELSIGKRIMIVGQYRSHNRHGEKHSLILNIFANEIAFIKNDIDFNSIKLNGYICKEPIYRETPLDREIADVMLAVNRNYGKSDYIPCICWGRNARFAGSLEVGTHICIEGRIQSREYAKKISENEHEARVAYEVSASKLEVVEDED